MQFLFGLFVGTFLGMTIIGLCRCMALNAGEKSCFEGGGINDNMGDATFEIQ